MKKSKVLFRVFPEGDVVAIFPNEIVDDSGNLNSYQHVGQHGACSPALIHELRPANESERLPLLIELKSIGYKLDLVDCYDDRLAWTFQNLSHTELCGTLYVSFGIRKTEWDKFRKTRSLGMLYGVDLSNYLGRLGVLNQYSVPVVDDKKRAKDGLKPINVTFYLRENR